MKWILKEPHIELIKQKLLLEKNINIGKHVAKITTTTKFK